MVLTPIIIPKVNVIYYKSLIPIVPEPPKMTENDKDYQKRINKSVDSIYFSQKPYFKRNLLISTLSDKASLNKR